jgi:hypothetical protein
LEWRDKKGLLRGILWVDEHDQLFIMTDPDDCRIGICMSLLNEAARRKLLPDLERQRYSWAGWLTMRRYLARRKAVRNE